MSFQLQQTGEDCVLVNGYSFTRVQAYDFVALYGFCVNSMLTRVPVLETSGEVLCVSLIEGQEMASALVERFLLKGRI
jgi:hypothetical protein